ncbi:MAG: TonB-dependent receptor [Candidatus Firestonebacteria bacterium]
MLRIMLVLSLVSLNIFAEENKQECGTTCPVEIKDVFQLDEIVVTGSRVEKLLREVPANISVVDKEKIKTSDSKNVGEVISNLISVDIGKLGTLGTAQSILLRGVSAEGTLILLDGVSLNSSYVGDVNLSLLNLDNIERIEVLRGPASSLYGANAVGGVVNIITKSKVDKPEITFSGDYGTFNTQDYKLSFENKFDNLLLNLTGSYEHSDGERENSKYDSYNLNGTINYNFSELSNLKLNFGGFKSDLGAPGSISWPSLTDKQKNEKLYSSLNFKIGLDDESVIKFNLYGARNILNFYSFTDTLSDEKNLDFETQYSYDLGGINILTLGGRCRYDVLEQSALGNKNATIKSVYAQDTLDLLGSWIFTAAVRYDNHSVYGDSFNPLAALIYNIEDNIQIKGSIGTSFRAPTFSNLYWPDEGWAEGNPNVKPEKSLSYDIGVSYDLADFLLVKETYFRNDLTDMIQWAQIDPLDSSSKWIPSNVSKVATYGLETELKVVPFNNLTGYVNHTWLFTKDESLDKELIYRPRNKVNLGMEYNIFGQKLSIDSEYYDKRFINTSNTRSLPNFIKTDVRLTLQINDYLQINLGIENIENVPYQLRDGYPMPGRTFNGGANITF